jgi:large subunit ribosomal protein L2
MKKLFFIPKATSPSRRHLVILCRDHLAKKPLIKTKISGFKNSTGRNNSGKITVRHIGGGHKKKYRNVDFYRVNKSTGIVCTIEYDPNRNSFIASVYDSLSSKFFYMLAPDGLQIGDIVKSGNSVTDPHRGNSMPLSNLTSGTYVHNVSPKEKTKAQLSRAAGTFSIIKEVKQKTEDNSDGWARISLKSGEHRLLSANCFATVGIASNGLYFLSQLGKAGQSRWLNRRPSVRGVAMNPVDHPHGGGEGKKSGKARTPWGKKSQRGRTSRSRNKLIIKKTKEDETS